MNRCKILENLPPATIPKKEWNYLHKKGFLTKQQVKFLKKAESVGYRVDIIPIVRK